MKESESGAPMKHAGGRPAKGATSAERAELIAKIQKALAEGKGKRDYRTGRSWGNEQRSLSARSLTQLRSLYARLFPQ